MNLEANILSQSREERIRLLDIITKSLLREDSKSRRATLVICLAEAVVQEKIISGSRTDRQVWLRKIIAYRLSQEGYTEKEIGKLIHKNASAINYMKTSMESALHYPNMFPEVARWWREFNNLINKIDGPTTTDDYLR